MSGAKRIFSYRLLSPRERFLVIDTIGGLYPSIPPNLRGISVIQHVSDTTLHLTNMYTFKYTLDSGSLHHTYMCDVDERIYEIFPTYYTSYSISMLSSFYKEAFYAPSIVSKHDVVILPTSDMVFGNTIA